MSTNVAAAARWNPVEVSRRQAELAMLYSGGATLQEVADIAGVSAERVRQLVRASGYTGRHTRCKVNASEVARLARTGMKPKAIADQMHLSLSAVWRVLGVLGLRSYWKESKRAELRDRCIRGVQGLGNKLGRTPTATELRAHGITDAQWIPSFGSLRQMILDSGLIPRAQGRHAGGPR